MNGTNPQTVEQEMLLLPGRTKKQNKTKQKRGKQMLLSRMTLVITYKQLKINKETLIYN